MLNESDESGVIRAVAAEINLGTVALDAYMLPNGEKRLGVENTGVALGYSNRFFFQRTKRESKALKALRDMGFSGEQIWVRIIRIGEDRRGSSLAKTVSLRDFIKLVTYEAIFKRNKKAIVLLAAFAETGIERILEDVFAGRSIDFILEKIVHYSKWTYEELEEVVQYNREEARALYSWGVPPSLDTCQREVGKFNLLLVHQLPIIPRTRQHRFIAFGLFQLPNLKILHLGMQLALRLV